MPHPSSSVTGGSFPKNFYWGTATSSHQVEGGNDANDWSEWESLGHIKTPSALACDHWRRFREDFDLAKSLGHTAHRFSLEWSRIEPEEGQINEGALIHYREVVDALRERNLEPFVTLHHFTLPRWIARIGGWSSPECVNHFLRYVKLVSDRLGDAVRYWVTINEPMILLYLGYIEGRWPPGEHSFEKAWDVLKNVVCAHSQAYHILHARRRNCWVGLAKHLRISDPYVPWMPTDWFSVLLRRFFFNHFLLMATTNGVPPLPGLNQTWIKEARQTCDYIGINYYTRDFIQFSASFIFGREKKNPLFGRIDERSSLGWEIYPEGLYRLLLRLKGYQKPVFILENGVATLQDERRIVFIRKHLGAVASALAEGVDIRGYFHWSLMDNFEWADGFEPRFGLVEVDYKTLTRKPRPSARFFAEICRSGKIPSV